MQSTQVNVNKSNIWCSNRHQDLHQPAHTPAATKRARRMQMGEIIDGQGYSYEGQQQNPEPNLNVPT